MVLFCMGVATCTEAIANDDDVEYASGAFGLFESRLSLEYERLKRLPDPPFPTGIESETSLALELDWELPLGSAFSLGTALSATTTTLRSNEEPRRDEESSAFLDQLFVAWSPSSSSGSSSFDAYVAVGRQDVSDDLGWWWGDTLDAIIIEGGSDSFAYQFGIATRNDDISTESIQSDPADDDVYWLLSSVSARNSAVGDIAVFALAQRDRSSEYRPGLVLDARDVDEVDANLNWLGLRLEREVSLRTAGRLGLRVDSAWLFGKGRLAEFVEEDEGDIADEGENEEDGEADVGGGMDVVELPPTASASDRLVVDSVTGVSLRAWAVDAAVYWLLPILNQPELSLGYAIGSGTRNGEAADSRTYREPTINDYAYGEQFDPALSNVEIASIALTLPLGENGYLELARYHYRKRHAEDTVDVGIDAETDTNSRHLGDETGVYLGFSVFADIYVGLSWSEFRPGRAYSAQDNNKSTLIQADIEYEFY